MNRRTFLYYGVGGLAIALGAPRRWPRRAYAAGDSRYHIQVEFGPADGFGLYLAPDAVADATVLGLLQTAADVLGMRLEAADYGPMGWLVTSLGAARNRAAAALYLWRNGGFLGRSASLQPLQPGDRVLARFRSTRPEFIRGDSNDDGVVDIADPVRSLGHKFRGLPLPCPDAADADDDGALTIADDLSVLRHLFLHGPSPPAPYPRAGPDPTSDILGCRW